MTERNDDFDVAVLGGGPAGAATAGLLALRGHRVLVLEREKFPRYHVGESLITGVLPTVEELGLRERLDRLGFTHKYGGTLLWGKSSVPATGWRALGPSGGRAGENTWEFRFSEASNYEHSYQVRRADFDALLLGRARELGARVIEEATAKEPVVTDGRVTGVTYTRKGDPEPHTATCRILVDATGQSHLLGRHFDLLEWHEDLRNIAVWTYFQGCDRYSGIRAGDIITENRPNGWFWFIPLHDGTVSVGYVTPIEEYQRTGKSLEELHRTELSDSPEIGALTRGADRVAAYRNIRDWSYTCRRMHGPGWALTGDAAAFIDPLLSTGVTLAVRGAHGLARSVHAALAHPADEHRHLSAYEKNYREFLDSVLEFIRFFYDQNRHKEEYWEKAQQKVDPRKLRHGKISFATMLSGLTGISEIFDDPAGDSAEPDTAEAVGG